MGEHRRKADGRRVFSTEFKRTAVQRILTGEKTLAELSRELDISPSVIRNWKRFAEAGRRHPHWLRTRKNSMSGCENLLTSWKLARRSNE